MDTSIRKEGGLGSALSAPTVEKSDAKGAVGTLARSTSLPFSAHVASEKGTLALSMAEIGSRVVTHNVFERGPVTRSVGGVALESLQPSGLDLRWADKGVDHLSYAGSAKLGKQLNALMGFVSVV